MSHRSRYRSKKEGLVTKKVIDWYTANALIDVAFLDRHLAKRVAPVNLTDYYPAIIETFNGLMQEALLSTAWTNDQPLTFATLARRLKRSEKEVSPRLTEITASQNLSPLSDAHIQTISELYTGWRLRMQHYITQLDKAPSPSR